MAQKKTQKPAKYPPLPTSLDAPGGRVKVKLCEKIVNNGQDCWGLWEESTRVISIVREMPPRHQWKVFYHEVAHIAITDAGLDDILTIEMHEALCNAIASQRMRERFGG